MIWIKKRNLDYRQQQIMIVFYYYCMQKRENEIINLKLGKFKKDIFQITKIRKKEKLVWGCWRHRTTSAPSSLMFYKINQWINYVWKIYILQLLSKYFNNIASLIFAQKVLPNQLFSLLFCKFFCLFMVIHCSRLTKNKAKRIFPVFCLKCI